MSNIKIDRLELSREAPCWRAKLIISLVPAKNVLLTWLFFVN